MHTAILLLALAPTSTPPSTPAPQTPATQCAAQAVAEHMPSKYIWLRVTKDLERLPEWKPTAAMTDKQYNHAMKLLLRVGEEGLVREASFMTSSGNRLVDIAMRDWAYGLIFKPQDCGPVHMYDLTLNLDIPPPSESVVEHP